MLTGLGRRWGEQIMLALKIVLNFKNSLKVIFGIEGFSHELPPDLKASLHLSAEVAGKRFTHVCKTKPRSWRPARGKSALQLPQVPCGCHLFAFVFRQFPQMKLSGLFHHTIRGSCLAADSVTAKATPRAACGYCGIWSKISPGSQARAAALGPAGHCPAITVNDAAQQALQLEGTLKGHPQCPSTFSFPFGTGKSPAAPTHRRGLVGHGHTN